MTCINTGMVLYLLHCCGAVMQGSEFLLCGSTTLSITQLNCISMDRVCARLYFSPGSVKLYDGVKNFNAPLEE